MQRHAGRYMTFPTDITTKPSGTSRLKPLNIPDAEIDRILGECIAAINGQIAPPDGLLLTSTKITRLTARQAAAVLEGRRKPRAIPSIETITPTTPLRLDHVARLAFPDGSVGVSALRKEIARGNLRAERIAGKLFVTLAAIEDMRKRCAVQKAEPISCSASQDVPANADDGSSSTTPATADVKQAQAHLNRIAQRLKKPSPTTLPKSTSPNSAQVVPLKS